MDWWNILSERYLQPVLRYVSLASDARTFGNSCVQYHTGVSRMDDFTTSIFFSVNNLAGKTFLAVFVVLDASPICHL